MTPHIIWIITGTCGKYSDRPWWVVCWRNTEEEAKAVVDVLNREATVNHARETDRPMSDPVLSNGLHRHSVHLPTHRRRRPSVFRRAASKAGAMTDSLALLATEALADDRVATKGPWEIIADDNAQQNIYADHGFDWIAMLPHQCVSSIEEMRKVDAEFIAAARTREPLLAAGVIDLTQQLAELRDEHAGLLEDVILGPLKGATAHDTIIDLTRQLAEARRILDAALDHELRLHNEQLRKFSEERIDLTRQLTEANTVIALQVQQLDDARAALKDACAIIEGLVPRPRHSGESVATANSLRKRGGL